MTRAAKIASIAPVMLVVAPGFSVQFSAQIRQFQVEQLVKRVFFDPHFVLRSTFYHTTISMWR